MSTLRDRIRMWFGEPGESLPSDLLRDHRGMFFNKRAMGSADELHYGMADSSDTMTTERILTKTYADTLYGGGSALIVQEGDVDVDTAVSTLDFDASDFNVTSSPAGEANVSLAYGTGAGTPAEGNHTHTGYVADTLVQAGSGSPEGSVTAAIGGLYLRTDANNGNQLYTKVTGSGTSGWATTAQAPRRRTVREILVRPAASATTHVVSKGFPVVPTFVASTTANADASTGFFLEHTTTAVSANVASVVAGANCGARFEWEPDLAVAFRSGASNTSIRVWVGLFSSTPSGSDDPTINGVGFRYSTNASDTNWQCWSNDNASGGTITDSGVAYNTGTAFDLRVIADPGAGAVNFFIGGAWVARHTTNLPAAATLLNYGIYGTTLSANTRNFRWGRITLETRP